MEVDYTHLMVTAHGEAGAGLGWAGTPWAVLPIELLHGITFGCAWAAGEQQMRPALTRLRLCTSARWTAAGCLHLRAWIFALEKAESVGSVNLFLPQTSYEQSSSPSPGTGAGTLNCSRIAPRGLEATTQALFNVSPIPGMLRHVFQHRSDCVMVAGA